MILFQINMYHLSPFGAFAAEFPWGISQKKGHHRSTRTRAAVVLRRKLLLQQKQKLNVSLWYCESLLIMNLFLSCLIPFWLNAGMAEAAAVAAAAAEAASAPVHGAVLVNGRWALTRITLQHDLLKAMCGDSLPKNWSVCTSNANKTLRSVPVADLWNALNHYGGIHLVSALIWIVVSIRFKCWKN